MYIAKKTKNEWLAFIPIANFYLFTQMAKKIAGGHYHYYWL